MEVKNREQVDIPSVTVGDRIAIEDSVHHVSISIDEWNTKSPTYDEDNSEVFGSLVLKNWPKTGPFLLFALLMIKYKTTYEEEAICLVYEHFDCLYDKIIPPILESRRQELIQRGMA